MQIILSLSGRRAATKIASRRLSAVDLRPLFGLLAGKITSDPNIVAGHLAQMWQGAMGGGRWADHSRLSVQAVPPQVQEIAVQGTKVSRINGVALYLLDLDKVLAPMLKKAAGLPDPIPSIESLLYDAFFYETDLRRLAHRELGHWFYMDAEGARRFRNPRFVLETWIEKLPFVQQLRQQRYEVLRFSARAASGSGGNTSGAHFDLGVDLTQKPASSAKMVQYMPPPDQGL